MKPILLPDPSGPGPGAPVIPGYTLLRCIGRGSYGDVWLARSETGEFYAVKVVHRDNFELERPFERELSGIQKFEPVSRTHPSQVAIFKVGVNRAQGYFYYVMELADDLSSSENNPGLESPSRAGAEPRRLRPENALRYRPHTLKSELQRGAPLPGPRCVEIGLALATALEHLHGNALIHRDIKPSNVIFVNGVPKLADIGLVTDVDSTISYVGTEGFLPPEGPVSPQADLYGLGKVLYEICTGRDRLDFPELPSLGGAAKRRDELLEWNQVLLRACQNDPRRRYRTARDLHADLLLLKSGKSVRRARSLEQRLSRARWAAVILAALALSFVGVQHFLAQRRLQQSRIEKEVEKQSRERAELRSERTSRQLAELASHDGRELLASGDAAGALLWFARSRLAEPARREHPETMALLAEAWSQSLLPERFLVSSRPGPHALSLSRLAPRLLATTPGLAMVWDLDQRQDPGKRLVLPQTLQQAVLGPHGDLLLALDRAGAPFACLQWNAEPLWLPVEPATALQQIQFSPQGRQFAGLTRGTNVLVWESGSRQLRYQLPHSTPVAAAAFSPDGLWLVTADRKASLRTWDMETGRLQSQVQLDLPEVSGLAFHPDAPRAAAWAGSRLQVWDVRSGELTPWNLAVESPIASVAFRPDGETITVGLADGSVRTWDAVNGRARGLRPFPVPVVRVAYSPDARWLAVGGGMQVRLWPSGEATSLARVVTFSSVVSDLSFSVAGQQLFIATTDGTIRAVPVARDRPPAAPRDLRVQDWISWGQWLSGWEFTEDGELKPLGPSKALALGHRLQPDLNAAMPPAALADWHVQQAEASERDGAWFAARHHWTGAAAGSSAGESLRARAEQAGQAWLAATARAARSEDLAARLDLRSPAAGPRQIDLGPHYNAALNQTWLPSRVAGSGNDLAELPRGLQKFSGTEFDLRGLVQLGGAALENAGGRFPKTIRDVAVAQPCRRLHILHGAAFASRSGTVVAVYQAHYSNGETRDIPVRFGQHLREWWTPATAVPLTPAAAMAWEGENSASRSFGMKLRLYHMVWINPLPDVPITTLDLMSTMENSAPFVLAITVE